MDKKLYLYYLKRDKKNEIALYYEQVFSNEAETVLKSKGGFGEIVQKKLNRSQEKDKKESLLSRYKVEFETWEKENAKSTKIISETEKADESNGERIIQKITEKPVEEYYKNEEGSYEIYYTYNGNGKKEGLIKCTKLIKNIEKAKIEEDKEYIYIKRRNDSDSFIEEKRNNLKPYKNENEYKIALGIIEPKNKEKKIDTITAVKKAPCNLHREPQSNINEGKSEIDLSALTNELITMKQEIKKLNVKIYDCARKTDVTNALDSKLGSLSRALKEYIEGVVVKGLSATPDKEFIAKKIDNMTEGVAETLDGFALDIQNTKAAAETIQGKVTAVEGILSKKGITISKESAPINDDAKAIANAKRLADKLISDIAAAAIEYGNNKEVLDNLSEKEAQRNQEMIERIERVRVEARQEILIELIDKFENIDALLECENNRMISAFLKNNGLTIDDELQKGDEIEISAEKCESYLARAKGVKEPGKYRVTRSAYHLGSKYFPAEIEKITE